MLKPTDYLIKLVLMIARPYRSVINLPHDHPTVSSFKGAAERRSYQLLITALPRRYINITQL